MIADLDADFIHLYRTLFLETTRFFGVQALVVVALLGPFIIFTWAGETFIHEWLNSKVDVDYIYPYQDVHLNAGISRTAENGFVPISALSSGKKLGFKLENDGTVWIRDVRDNNVICPNDEYFRRFFFTALGFTVTSVDAKAFGVHPHPIICRPWHGDSNPFWPYLSDSDAYLFLGMGIFSIPAILFFQKRRIIKKEAHQENIINISMMDFLLVSIATAAQSAFRWLGDKESRYFEKELNAIEIDRPIFITGMARSGTTIILELLSSIPSVATHRYRDFPFVMTPILWQHFTNFFSSEKPPLERPHKDGIMITRESPEAFEEPIWQYFFPHANTAKAIHMIREEDGSKDFAKFFSDHIRKILLIRRGNRYLSKGNYNVTRIPYLLTLFPDACFVIPVRHPVEHVWSLVRQNGLFQRYSEEDGRVPQYLSAVGHYEFGPQRKPVILQKGTKQKILDAWSQGKEHVGYAIQWAEIYRFVNELIEDNSPYADRLFILRYEDICAHPSETLTKVADFCGLLEKANITTAVSRITPGRVWSKELDEEICLEIWNEVRDVANLYGYYLDGNEIAGQS